VSKIADKLVASILFLSSQRKASNLDSIFGLESYIVGSYLQTNSMFGFESFKPSE